MGKDAAEQIEIRALVDAALRGQLDAARAGRVYELGREVCVAFALAMNARIAELSASGVPMAIGPHTPSGSIPAFAKGATGRKRPGKPGARMGHEGRRRATPIPDRVETVEEIEVCPECKGRVLPMRPNRRRRLANFDAHRVELGETALMADRDLRAAEALSPNLSPFGPYESIRTQTHASSRTDDKTLPDEPM